MQQQLRQLSSLIESTNELQRRTLDVSSAVDEALATRMKRDVESLADDIRTLSSQLKRRIQGFEADHSILRQRKDPDGDLAIRVQQLTALKARFVECVQRYAEVEQNQRRAIRAKVERQIRVVRPDATDAEIKAAVEDEQNGGAQIFQQAVSSLSSLAFRGADVSVQISNSQRAGAARNVLRDVQSRGEDIKRIERTITELAQLFNDVRSTNFTLFAVLTLRPQLALMVEEQDTMIVHIEQKAMEINNDTEQACVPPLLFHRIKR